MHLDHLGTPRLVTNASKAQVSEHHYHPFGEEATAGGLEPMKFTGHERDLNGTTANSLDYMHARYCSPVQGRFLSVDPINSGGQSAPQSWNKYAYGLNNPLKFVDPDGRTALKYLIRFADDALKVVSRATARKSAKGGGDVIIRGDRGVRSAQKSLGLEAYGRGNIVRHTRQEGSLPHLQPKNRVGRLRKGHIFVDKPGKLTGAFLAVATVGAAAGDELEATTGSDVAGNVVAFGVDFLNPASDVLAAEQLLESIGIVIIERAYDVSLEEEILFDVD